VNSEQVRDWVAAYERAWRAPGTGALAEIFTTDASYRQGPYDEPVVWMMVEGEAQVRVDGVKEPTHFRRGETVLLPAKMTNPTIKTIKDCVWLEVTFPTKPEIG